MSKAHLLLPEALKGHLEGEQLKHDDAKAVAAAAAAQKHHTHTVSIPNVQVVSCSAVSAAASCHTQSAVKHEH